MICYSIPAATILTFSVSAAFSQPVPDSMAVEWQGKKMCENLYEDAQVRVLRCSFPPRSIQGKHSHSGYFGYVLSGGKFTVEDDKGKREVEQATGQSGASPPTLGHIITNTGDNTFSVLLVEKKYEPVH
jgi:quercetin dioxygenase-like cupin family protein